ncbi:hypothetical protein B0T26DRAFT_752766 [Lasiosphaeria miniovina]|uniref:Uncharacterized protein n=1 Tax=Lasiosphaeria miniovina TaxID=1954250 RepID=A0AA40AB78_9PEZI|nr:uncharacterized protein B0T26DRAFT_752766 [Lasiosphaeria miniovina]KAK0712540.1 hypothetical protein B0T26DRAFT_752766 [Lasiosphaeria miniovina]
MGDPDGQSQLRGRPKASALGALEKTSQKGASKKAQTIAEPRGLSPFDAGSRRFVIVKPTDDRAPSKKEPFFIRTRILANGSETLFLDLKDRSPQAELKGVLGNIININLDVLNATVEVKVLFHYIYLLLRHRDGRGDEDEDEDEEDEDEDEGEEGDQDQQTSQVEGDESRQVEGDENGRDEQDEEEPRDKEELQDRRRCSRQTSNS